MLLAVEWYLTLYIPGTSYCQPDGKAYQADILTTFHFGGLFNVTNLGPLQGFGSLLLPMNVWLNPAYWPFAMPDTLLATNISVTAAVGCLAVACYVMSRCFDVPLVPSIIAAQLVIVMFPPLARLVLVFYEMLWLNPGIAIVYAAPLLALGLLARLNTGRTKKLPGKGFSITNFFRMKLISKDFIYITGGVFAFLLYGICCDPLWMGISGIALLGAFIAVAFIPFDLGGVLLRCAALCCCLVLLIASGALVYFYTLSQYTARVWHATAVYYVPAEARFLVSVAWSYPATFVYYGLCGGGWLAGLLFARGRPRLLVGAALGSLVLFVAQAAAYLFSAKWSTLPLPIYVEEAAMPLFTTAAVAGYWTALSEAGRQLGLFWLKARGTATSRFFQQASRLGFLPSSSLVSYQRLTAGLTAIIAAAVVPAGTAAYGVSVGSMWPPILVPFPHEPELLHYFEGAIGLRVGGQYRGTVLWPVVNDTTTTAYNLWMHGIPTANEYSQTFSPVVMYLFSSVFRLPIQYGFRNGPLPAMGPEGSYDVFLKTLQALGVRHLVYMERSPPADQKQFPFVVFPRRPPIEEGGGPSRIAPGDWVVYRLPEANIGNYSPTKIIMAKTGAEIATILRTPDFDFKEDVVLTSALSSPLLAASGAELSIIRNGLHLKAHSDGTSLIVLPQQFSRCLRARDARVRLVRANLLMTGVIFSSAIDTDISFDYGVFSPWCRLADMHDTKSLDLVIKPGDDADRVVRKVGVQ